MTAGRLLLPDAAQLRALAGKAGAPQQWQCHHLLPRSLQRALTASLSGRAKTGLWLNRHDPMWLFSDYGSLDQAINILLKNQDS